MRKDYYIDEQWSFLKGRPQRKWITSHATDCERVSLPHCWNSRDAFQNGVAYYRGPGSYQKIFQLDETEKPAEGRWLLHSEGFYGTGSLWLNGHHIADVDGAYLGFEHDITNYLSIKGDNRLTVFLTNKCRRHILPGIKMPDFLLYGGLSGRICLKHVSATRIASNSLFLRPGAFNHGDAAVPVTIGVDCLAGNGEQLSVDAVVSGSQNNDVLQTLDLKEVSPGHFEAETVLQSPPIWDVDDPKRISVTARLKIDGQLRDEITMMTGIRHAEFRSEEGFFLNGRRLEVRGWNRHESMPGFGRAVPDGLHEVDAMMLKECGGNAVRLSHYPQAPEFLDHCDRLGILVLAEIATWKSVREGRWLRNALAQLKGMMLRDRHHPSVFMWGMGNESRSFKGYQQMNALIQEIDPTRPSTYAENHLYRGRRHNTLDLPDVLGVNYELDVMDEARDVSRNKVVVVTEMSNNPMALRGDIEQELSQAETIHDDLSKIKPYAFNAGYMLWCMNDYSTLRKERYKRYSGLIDAWRVPKAAWYYHKGRCSSEPVLHAVAEWGKCDGDEKRRVLVAGTPGALRIECAGKLLLEEPEFKGVGVWSFPFCNDPLQVFCGDAGFTIHPYGRARQLRAEKSTRSADRCLIIDIMVLDEDGHLVQDYNGMLKVGINGAGRPCFYTPADSVSVFRGMGRLFLFRTELADSCTVTIAGDGFDPIELADHWDKSSRQQI